MNQLSTLHNTYYSIVIGLGLWWSILTDLVHCLILSTITWLGSDYFMCIHDLAFVSLNSIHFVHFSSMIIYLVLFLLMSVMLLLIAYRIVTIIPLLIGNICLVYVMGIVVILFFVVFYSVNQAVSLLVLFLLLNLSTSELFLLILFFIEVLSLVFTTFTISNRISINIIAGSLLIELIIIFVIFTGSNIFTFTIFVINIRAACLLWLSSTFIIFLWFELTNLAIQFLIMFLLSCDYILQFITLQYYII